jgi:hypothetical protein
MMVMTVRAELLPFYTIFLTRLRNKYPVYSSSPFDTSDGGLMVITRILSSTFFLQHLLPTFKPRRSSYTAGLLRLKLR